MAFLNGVLSSVQSVFSGGEAKQNGILSRSYSRIVYYGTFISFARHPESAATPTSAPKHRLIVDHGALWVGSKDGRIEGFDWSIRDERGLDQLMRRMGWIAESEPGEAVAEVEVVKVVRARSEMNEFFFPGFVGEFVHT